jgi:putative ABC transport system permease protein
MSTSSVTASPPTVSPAPGGGPPGSRRGLLVGANLRAAFKALQANGLRSFLTMLGIIIGVAAVIAAVTLTAGVSANVTQRFTGLGTNVLTVVPSTSPGGVLFGGLSSTLAVDDASAVAGVAHVTAVSPVANGNGQVIYGGQNWRPHLLGVHPGYQNIQNWQIAEGSWFSADDELAAAPDVVVGSTTVQNLFGPTGADPIGKVIRINGQVFHVVGTLQPKGINLDDSIFMPFSTYQQRINNSPFLNQIQVQADNVQDVAQVQQDITALLEQRHHIQPGAPDDFSVNSVLQFIQQAQQEIALLTSLFVGIAAVSLTVGGIGIMNIMLVSVSERTREIGIRMAVGARRRDIRGQFLVEAVILSVLGGLLGIVIGLAAGYELVQVVQIPFVITGFSILLPVAVAAIVGIVFGFYPAALASNLDPIVALRTD